MQLLARARAGQHGCAEAKARIASIQQVSERVANHDALLGQHLQPARDVVCRRRLGLWGKRVRPRDEDIDHGQGAHVVQDLGGHVAVVRGHDGDLRGSSSTRPSAYKQTKKERQGVGRESDRQTDRQTKRVRRCSQALLIRPCAATKQSHKTHTNTSAQTRIQDKKTKNPPNPP